MKTLETCHHCGEEKENCYHGFIAMTLPIPEAEVLIEKWGGKEWWKNLEREDLTEEEMKELDGLATYDQLLNTVGRGVQCDELKRDYTKAIVWIGLALITIAIWTTIYNLIF